MPGARDKPFSDAFPIAPAPFEDGGDLDLDGQCHVLDCMIDQGVGGICILANREDGVRHAGSDPADQSSLRRGDRIGGQACFAAAQRRQL
jgi:hypothetical protein